MNLAQLLIGLVILAAAIAIGLRLRKSGVSDPSTTNLLLLGIAGLLSFFAYQHVQSENRAAVAALDYSRCWTDGCKTDVTYALTGGSR